MQRNIHILGVPMDLGQSRRGVDTGPSAVRYANLKGRLEQLGHVIQDEGNVTVLNPEEHAAKGSGKRRRAITAVCQTVYERAYPWIADGEFAIFLGGDHSISMGSVAAAATRGPIGVIWIDAHSDFNIPETSPSGNIHGMPVAAIVGEGPDELVNIGSPGATLTPQQVVQIGLRNLDTIERERVVRSGIHAFSMRHVDEFGMAVVARQALDRLRHLPRIHVSLDMDSLDPSFAPGVGTPVPGGLTYREAHLLMEILGDSGRVESLDIVEINPILDDMNKTAELAVGLAASLLGLKIL